MTTRLTDGSIVPSFLGQFVRSSSHLKDEGSHSNLALRMGEVVNKYPKTQGHQTVMTYDVSVAHADHKRAQTTVLYVSCVVVNLFGGAADYQRWTLRPRTGPINTATGFGNGSKVLLLCVNGRTTQAWIIGGVMDNTTPSDDPDPALKYFQQVFNGVEININNDGEYSVGAFGPTDQTGAQITQDSDVVSPLITLDKNNNILLNSEGVLTGEHTDNTVLGSTYIEAEKSALEDFVSNMQQAVLQIAAAGTALQVIAPPAGTALGMAASYITEALNSISAFTSNSDDYLSKKNKSD